MVINTWMGEWVLLRVRSTRNKGNWRRRRRKRERERERKK